MHDVWTTEYGHFREGRGQTVKSWAQDGHRLGTDVKMG